MPGYPWQKHRFRWSFSCRPSGSDGPGGEIHQGDFTAGHESDQVQVQGFSKQLHPDLFYLLKIGPSWHHALAEAHIHQVTEETLR